MIGVPTGKSQVAIGVLRNSRADTVEKQLDPWGLIASRRRSVRPSVRNMMMPKEKDPNSRNSLHPWMWRMSKLIIVFTRRMRHCYCHELAPIIMQFNYNICFLSRLIGIDRFAKMNVGNKLDGSSIWRMPKLILVFTGRKRHVLFLSCTG